MRHQLWDAKLKAYVEDFYWECEVPSIKHFIDLTLGPTLWKCAYLLCQSPYSQFATAAQSLAIQLISVCAKKKDVLRALALEKRKAFVSICIINSLHKHKQKQLVKLLKELATKEYIMEYSPSKNEYAQHVKEMVCDIVRWSRELAQMCLGTIEEYGKETCTKHHVIPLLHDKVQRTLTAVKLLDQVPDEQSKWFALDLKMDVDRYLCEQFGILAIYQAYRDTTLLYSIDASTIHDTLTCLFLKKPLPKQLWFTSKMKEYLERNSFSAPMEPPMCDPLVSIEQRTAVIQELDTRNQATNTTSFSNNSLRTLSVSQYIALDPRQQALVRDACTSTMKWGIDPQLAAIQRDQIHIDNQKTELQQRMDNASKIEVQTGEALDLDRSLGLTTKLSWKHRQILTRRQKDLTELNFNAKRDFLKWSRQLLMAYY